jgi:pimeloyl-ACP methyl ester carboxylesterase
MEITEHHPFRSAKAKEDYLKLYDELSEKWPVPSENQMVTTTYGQTFVRVSGPINAPPLVLLHGMSSNSLMWIKSIEELSKDFRTYAVDDVYGNGRSIYTIPIKKSNDFVNWLNELFDELGLDNNINLMGMSYGGWQVSQYALEYPEKLNKIVLLSPAATILPINTEFAIRGLFTLIPVRYFTKSLMYWVFEDLVKKDRKMVDLTVDQIYKASKSFKSRRAPEPTVLDDNELKNIKTPTLYVLGVNEKIYSAQKALKRINKIAPQIKTELIPNTGHDLLALKTELVNRKVLEFLK